MIQQVLQRLYDLPLASLIRQNAILFPWVESVHVAAIALVVGSIIFVDFRLLGITSRDRPVSLLARQMLPLTWSAFALAVLTGGTLFVSNALTYYANLAFRLKMLLMLLAGINMLLFHAGVYREVLRWDMARPPPRARVAGAVSLVLWVGIVACGRWIGFTIGLGF